MSAHFNSRQAQGCAVAAARSVLSQGQPEDIARWLDCSTDTVERMLRTDDESRFTHARMLRLVAYERTVLHSQRLRDALISCMAEAAPAASGEAVESDLSRGLVDLLGFARLQAAAIADGRVDGAELRGLLQNLPLVRDTIDRLERDARARLNGGAL